MIVTQIHIIMVKSPKDIFVGVVLITTVLLAVTSHLWLNKVQTIVTLFDDTIAIILLGLVVLLMAWYDCKMGIAFAILIGMVAITVKTSGFTQYMETFTDMSGKSTVQIPISKKTLDMRSSPTSKSQDPVSPNTEITTSTERRPVPSNKGRDTSTARNPVKKTHSFKTTGGSGMGRSGVTEQFTNPNSFGLEPENGAQIIQDKMTSQMEVSRPCDKDFLTYTRGTDYHGYDVAGCRYDLKDGNQNGSIYGPPLSWCATYKDNKHAVPFYPLNG